MPPSCCIRCKANGPDFKNRSFSWRKIISWSLLDFSNSIVLMILLFQYTSFVNKNIYPNQQAGTNNFMYANIAVSIVTFIISPPIGVLIDRYYIRIPILVISIILYSVASMVLYAVGEGDLELPIVMYAIGMLFFRLNEMVCGAFIPSLCNDRDMGFVSSFGYVVGFISGIIIVLLSKLFTNPPPGTADRKAYEIQGYATLMLICGIIQLLSGLPPMLMLDNGLPEGEKRPKFTKHTIPDSFKENARTIRDSFKISKGLTLVMLCYIFISVGVQTVQSYGQMAIIRYGGKYGYTFSDVQNVAIFFNVIVGVSCLVYGVISKYIGAYALGVFALAVAVISNIGAFFWDSIPQSPSYNPALFMAWFTYALAGIGPGPAQAFIRGVVGVLCEEEKKGEVYGCLESMIIFGSLLGTTVPGVIINYGLAALYGWVMAFFALALIVWACTPLKKEEEKMRLKREELKRKEAETAPEAGGNVDVVAEIAIDTNGSSSDVSSESLDPRDATGSNDRSGPSHSSSSSSSSITSSSR